MVSSAPLPCVLCSQAGPAKVCSTEVPDRYSAVVVQRSACPCANPQCCSEPVIGVLESIDCDGVVQALADYGSCVEMSFGTLLCGDNLRPTLDRDGLYLALTTTTAYSAEPARLFCLALAGRLGLSEALRDSMELAVHEAVVNGLMHGNLEMLSLDRQSLEGFQRYCLTVESNLADPQMAARRIEVFATWDEQTVSLSVVDSGTGYDPDALVISADPCRKSGRGLELIRDMAGSVEIGDGGRRLTMRFSR